MKTIEYIRFALVAIFICLSACTGGDEPIEPTPKPEVIKSEITIDSNIISNGLSFTNDKGEQSISFSTNENWTLSVASTTSGAAWCTASATSGSKGAATVKFDVEENTSHDNRSVSVTIKCGTATKTFSISQKGVDALLITTDKYEVTQDGGTIEIEVKANISYKMEISEKAKDWIKESSSRALSAYKHKFDIAANGELEKREGEIYFKSEDKVETVKVYQTGGAILLLSENVCNVSDKGDTISVDIRSNVEFGVQMPDVDWIVDEASSRGLSSHTLKYVVKTNEGYDPRSASIVFFGKNSELKDTLVVNQAQKDAIILSNKEVALSSDAQTIEVKLSTNVDFEISIPGVDWINRVDSRGLAEYSCYFAVTENVSNYAREGEIVFSNRNNKVLETIKIIQNRKEKGLELPSGTEFSSIVGDFLTANSNLEKIKFISNSDRKSDAILVTDKNNSIGYMIANGDYLEIHTSGEEFIANSSCSFMFMDEAFNFITEIDFGDNFNTGNVRTMNRMFNSCKYLEKLNVGSFNTDKVTSMRYMFSGCEYLEELDVSNFNTSNVTSLDGMFYDCKYLNKLKTSGFNTEKVTSMSYMFRGCENLKSVDVSGFNTRKVKDLSGMFYDCKSLEEIDLSKFDTKTVDNLSFMFSGCENLKFLDLSNFNTENVTDMNAMFQSCLTLTELDVSSFETKNVTSMGFMFSCCENLKSLDVSNFKTEKVTDMSFMFQSCFSLLNIDVSRFDTRNVTNLSGIFARCKNLKTLDIANFNTDKVVDMSNMFSTCELLDTLDLSNFNTSNVNNMSYMFSSCGKISSLDLRNFNTENVTDMSYMFYSCNNLGSLDVSSFNTNKVINMSNMFGYCSTLTTLDVTNFNTKRVKDMEQMFMGCFSLTSLDLSNFSFDSSPKINSMLSGVGSQSTIIPVGIKVTKEGYNYLKENAWISSLAKFVKSDGTDW